MQSNTCLHTQSNTSPFISQSYSFLGDCGSTQILGTSSKEAAFSWKQNRRGTLKNRKRREGSFFFLYILYCLLRFCEMGISKTGGQVEGWLCTVRSNRFGQQFARKRYFILKDNNLLSYKVAPSSEKKEPVRSAVIDSSIRVTDNGRENIQKKVLFVFTLHHTSDRKDKLKLGASSSEEAAKWIHSLQDAGLKECSEPQIKSLSSASKRRWPSLRFRSSKHRRASSFDWNAVSSLNIDTMKPDVIAPSPWKIFGCQNGLRLFKESKDGDSYGTYCGDHPAFMAVGVVYGTSEDIFSSLMSFSSSRSEWDYCVQKGSVVEHIDGHTDIIHKQLHGDWLPWGMKRRDLLLRRYWRREGDGTYVILYHSVSHGKCQPQSSCVRACVKSGGYVITPVHEGRQSLVKHMLAIDWKFWNLHFRPLASRALTIRMLERIAALRELFKTKQGICSHECSSVAGKMDIRLLQTQAEDTKELKEEDVDGYGQEKMPGGSLTRLDDSSDEFFDVPESTESTDNDEQSENEWPPEGHSQSLSQPKVSAAGLVKRLHDFAIQKKGYVDLQDIALEDGIKYCYGTTLQKDADCSLPCTWSEADPSAFLIRGKSYLEDSKKTKAKGTIMEMIGADWLSSDKREDDLGSRLCGIVQESAARGGPEFYFIVNIQVPGTTTYTLALYYVLTSPLEDHPLLKRFVEGDDAFRNSRFKLIPYISKGSWIVKQSVGKKACLVGQALEVLYFRGKNYLELEIDVGSSTVARGVVSLVLGYLNNLVIEMAFLIQGNTQEELPEFLLGTCRLNHLDVSKCVPRKELV